MIVLDASALIEMLLQTPLADRLMERAVDPSERLHAPYLLDIEVTHALRRLVQLKAITAPRASLALDDLSQLLVERHAHQDLVPRIWALRDSLTAYDATYVVLAEGLGAPLLTCDGRLARSAGHLARIELISDA